MSAAHPIPARRLAYDDVASTNTLALDAARAGDPGNLWVTARRQIDGRGRRGRLWVSEAGNLYASWLGIDIAEPAALAKLPFVAAVAVRAALDAVLGNGVSQEKSGPGKSDTTDSRGRVSVKWPNDILIDGQKCVGILLESERLEDGRQAVVFGCGINIGHFPQDLPTAATCLADEGYRGDVETVFQALGECFASSLSRFDRGSGFSEIREEWLAHAVGLGAPCTVRLTDRTLIGTFESLDADGRLRLALPDGRRMPISAGDVFFSSAP